MDHWRIMSAEEARKQLVLKNTPEELAKREVILLRQTLDSINKNINKAIEDNLSYIYFPINEKVDDKVKEILKGHGYQVRQTMVPTANYRIEW